MTNLTKNDHLITLKDGRRLGYCEYGDPKGKPLFYFHGWPGCRLMVLETNKAAKKMGIRVISADRPGYGLSDYKEDRALLDWPEDVSELADQLKIKKFAVMGVSGGGPYAAVCAFKMPERITKVGIVVGLGPSSIKGAFDGLAKLNKFSWESYNIIPGFRQMAAFLYVIMLKFFPQLTGIGFGAKVDRQINKGQFKQMMIRSLKESFRQGSKGPAWDLKIYTSPWGFKVKDIKSKVYLWYGDADKNVSLNMGKYYASHIKGSKLTIYPGEGHFCRVNHEEEILKTLT